MEASKSVLATGFSVLLSLIAIIISFLNLYYSQLRHKSLLAAFVSDLSVSQENVQEDETSITADRSVDLKLSLTNTGNAPSSLLKVFFMVPKAIINFDCAKTSEIRWDFLSADFFNSKYFQGKAFKMSPVVVPPLGIAAVEGNIHKQHISHFHSSEPVDYYSVCLAFVAMRNSGDVVMSAFPAAKLGLSMSSSVQYDPAIERPLDLLK